MQELSDALSAYNEFSECWSIYFMKFSFKTISHFYNISYEMKIFYTEKKPVR